MILKKYYKNKYENFVTYWEQKRKNRIKYSVLESLYFTIPFSIIFQAIESLQGFFSLKFGFKFATIFSFYFLLTHFISFKIYEKKYQKLKKQS